jgi:hypothetical protein
VARASRRLPRADGGMTLYDLHEVGDCVQVIVGVSGSDDGVTETICEPGIVVEIIDFGYVVMSAGKLIELHAMDIASIPRGKHEHER